VKLVTLRRRAQVKNRLNKRVTLTRPTAMLVQRSNCHGAAFVNPILFSSHLFCTVTAFGIERTESKCSYGHEVRGGGGRRENRYIVTSGGFCEYGIEHLVSLRRMGGPELVTRLGTKRNV
jgi:hypothetical protein